MTLWLVILVTLTNHNVTSVQNDKNSCEKREKKDTCDIVVGQCHQCHQPQCHVSIIRLELVSIIDMENFDDDMSVDLTKDVLIAKILSGTLLMSCLKVLKGEGLNFIRR